MKFNKIITVCVLIITLVFQACKDVIDVEPEFQKDGAEIFTTLDDYQFALTGAYALFRQVGYFGSGGQTTSTWGTLPDMMADNVVQTGEDLANWQPQVNWVFNTAEPDIQIAWIAAYSVVAEANLVLRGLDNFASQDPERVNRIKGQALAIRAMAHFDLLRFWAEEYDRNSTTLGIPYITDVDIELKPARLSVKDSWDNILNDMLAAEIELSAGGEINTATNKSYIDLVAVRALLARMYLYSKEYASAENYATLAINEVPLASRANFPNIWKDASVAEVLWSVAFNAGEGTPSAGVHIASSNRNRFRPSAPLEATFDQANDVRFTPYFTSRNLSGNPRRILTKFFGRGIAADNLVNWKALRTGEVYLIRAEARARQAGVKESLGLADLNDLRNARITAYTPVSLSGTALIDAIELERRKELIGEGHRWFDLKRTSKSINRTDSSLPSTELVLIPTDREWTWPIPQGEIDANLTIQPQQTPGY